MVFLSNERRTIISLLREIILQPMGEQNIEIEYIPTKLCRFKTSRGHPSKMAKWRLELKTYSVLEQSVITQLISAFLFYLRLHLVLGIQTSQV